jgi:hypothetical protein
MAFGAPEIEALYEGYAQKGFRVLSIDGSPMPLGSTATHETTGLKTLWIKKQSNPKQINISDNQQPSGDKRLLGGHRLDEENKA